MLIGTTSHSFYFLLKNNEDSLIIESPIDKELFTTLNEQVI